MIEKHWLGPLQVERSASSLEQTQPRIRFTKNSPSWERQGLFNAPIAIETYTKVFDEEGALDRLEAFASLNGPAHYRLPPNKGTITLERKRWTAPEEITIPGAEKRALVYRGGEQIDWQVTDLSWH